MRKKFSTTLEEDLIKRIKIRSAKEGITTAALVEKVLEAYISEKEAEEIRAIKES